MGTKRHHSMREDCRHEDSLPQHSDKIWLWEQNTWLVKSLEPHYWILDIGLRVITVKNNYRQGQRPVRINLPQDKLNWRTVDAYKRNQEM